jgi:hypothetical protein
MEEKQIFISYSKKNKEYARQIYNDLLWDGYWVWMDPRIEKGKKWRPQIDHNLKLSNRCIVLISPEAIDSKWVQHEISMACGRDQVILPVKIKDYAPKELPIGVEEIQLFNLVEGKVDYERELKKLKQRLGKPIPVQRYLEDMLILYQISEVLLSEVALQLYEKHKKEIVWPEGKEALAKELIEKSYRALQNYWDRYDTLERDYLASQKELNSKMYLLKLGFAFLIFVDFVVVVYVLAYLLK